MSFIARTICVALFVFSSSTIASHNYYPEKFHQAFKKEILSGSSLTSTLRNILMSKHIEISGKRDQLVNRCNSKIKGRCYGHKSLNYYDAKKVIFGDIHLDEDSNGPFIKDLYCEINYREDDFSKNRTLGPGRVPDHNIINCEHTWPKYRFSKHFSRNTQEADMHHLYPTNSRANSARGHYTFAEVDEPGISSTCPNARKGHSVSGHGKLKYQFEPPESHKGNVARALFYFSIRYNLKIDEDEEAYLKEWHKLDPVDEFERWRNNQIWKHQGNRNPFIDYPHLVELIDNF